MSVVDRLPNHSKNDESRTTIHRINIPKSRQAFDNRVLSPAKIFVASEFWEANVL